MSSNSMMMDSVGEMGGAIDKIIAVMKKLEEEGVPEEAKKFALTELDSASRDIREALSKVYEIGNKPKKTVTIDEILEKVAENRNTHWELSEIFEQYPFERVREAVIDALIFQTKDVCKWTRDWILKLDNLTSGRDMSQSDREKRLCRKLFTRYVGERNYDNIGFHDRAIEWALCSVDEPSYSSLPNSFTFKVVNDALKSNPNLWWQVPSLRRAIQVMLRSIAPYSPDKKREYNENDWIQTKRAVERILDTEDFTYLSEIDAIICEMENGQSTANEARCGFASRATHETFLQKAVKELEAVARFNNLFFTNLSDLVETALHIPSDVSFSAEVYICNGDKRELFTGGKIIAIPGKKISIEIELQFCASEREWTQFAVLVEMWVNDLICNYVNYESECTIAPLHLPTKKIAGRMNSIFSVFKIEEKEEDDLRILHCKAGFEVTPNKGHNRLPIKLHFEDKVLCETTILIVGDEKAAKAEK